MLTPIDIQNHVLKSTMGGYNKKETDDFIESVQASYEQLYKENHDLKEKVTALSEGLQYYKQMEGTLQKTLVLAEKTATETLEASRTKASKVEKESQEKANVMLSSAKAKADSMLSESETKAQEILSDSQTKADSILSESQTKADSILLEAQTKADTLTEESQKKSETVVSEAQTKSDNLLANANERVERVLAEAKDSANQLLQETKDSTEQMLTDANRQLSEVSSTVRTLITCYEDYKEQFKALLNKQLAQLDDPAFLIQVPDLEQTLESQQVSIAESQTALLNKIDEMATKTEELDLPVEDTAPVKEEVVSEDMNWEIGGSDENISTDASLEEDTEDLVADLSASATASGIEVPDENAVSQALAAQELSVDAAASVETESGEETVSEDVPVASGDVSSSSASEDESEAALNSVREALQKASSEVIPKSLHPSDELSMLGTSYDDFEPASATESAQPANIDVDTTAASALEAPSFESEEEIEFKQVMESSSQQNQPAEEDFQADAAMSDLEKAMEQLSSFEKQLQEGKGYDIEAAQPVADEQSVVPMPDFSTATTEASEQPNIPMPDFAKAMEAISSYEDSEDVSGQEVPEQPVVPMPDFAATTETPEQPNIPMPDFAKAMEAMSSYEDTTDGGEVTGQPAAEQPVVPMPDFARRESQTVQEEEPQTNVSDYGSVTLHPDEYITAETNFGSADNIPYTGALAADFSNGISGEETKETAEGADLFSADFSGANVPPADEFAVSGDSASQDSDASAFTFIDAEE